MNKVKFSTDALTEALKKVKPAIAKNAVLASLEDVLISISKNDIRVTATNLEMYITASVPAESTIDAVFCLDPNKLLRLSQNLPKQQIELQYDAVNGKITAECGGIMFEMEATDAGNFPKTPEVGEILSQMDMDKNIVDCCATAIKFTSTDTLRPALTGVYFDYSDKSLRIAATNAHTLYVSEKHNGTSTHSYIVPATAMKVICNLQKKQYGSISFTETHCVLDCADTVLVCRLIDVRFPDYKAVMPLGDKYFSVNRTQLLTTLTSMLPFANKVTDRVDFEINGKLKIEVSDIDFQTSATKELDIHFKNVPDFHFALNGQFLQDVLSTTPVTNIKFFNPGDGRKAFKVESNDCSVIIMPLMVA